MKIKKEVTSCDLKYIQSKKEGKNQKRRKQETSIWEKLTYAFLDKAGEENSKVKNVIGVIEKTIQLF